MESLVPLSDDWRPAKTEVTPLAKADWPLIGLIAASLVVDLAIFLYVCVAGFVRQPYSDMFDFLRAEFDLERTGALLGYLASPHNHQHLVWVRVLTAIDVQTFHGTGIIFLVSAALAILVGAAVVGLEIWQATSVRVVGAIGALLAAALVVSTVNAMDVTQPINSVYAIAFGFAVLAVVFFERAGADMPGRGILPAILALAAGLAATAGSAAGVAVFPVLLISAVRHPSSRALIAPTLVVGLAAIGVVLAALLAAAPAHPAGGGMAHLWKMADYFVVYAGMPWSSVRFLSRLRLGLGLLTIAVGAVLLWRGPRREGAEGRLERVGLDLILFALATAAMAALGRSDENEAVIVPVRYAVFMSAFQAGLICVLAPVIAERWAGLKRPALAGALVLSVALLAQQVAAGASVLRTSQFIRGEIAAFAAGQRRADMRQLIHPDFGIAAQVQAECRRRGLYQ